MFTKDDVYVRVPYSVIENIIKYCEDKQIYDKLSIYNDFYYKLKKIENEHNI